MSDDYQFNQPSIKSEIDKKGVQHFGELTTNTNSYYHDSVKLYPHIRRNNNMQVSYFHTLPFVVMKITQAFIL